MTATATKPRKAAKAMKKIISDLKAISLRPMAEIESELQVARAKVTEIDRWDSEKLEEAGLVVSKLEDELDLARLQNLPAADALVPKAADADVAIDKIVVTGNHREGEADGADIVRLARSMVAAGLQQRIGVRAMAGDKYELIWGSRRRRAAIVNGWVKIPAKVFPAETTPEQVELLRDIENFNRKDLTPVERAIAVARTIDIVEKMATPRTDEGRQLIKRIEAAGGTESYVGQLLGYEAAWVRDHAYVSKLGGKARSLLSERRITIEHARELAKLGDPTEADSYAEQSAKKSDHTGGESITWLRARVLEQLRSLKSVPWRLDVKFPKTGECLGVACDACTFNSRSDPKLFEHDASEENPGAAVAGICRNGPCFNAKKLIAEKDIEKALAKVQTAIKKADDDETLPMTERGLADFIPATVRGATFARKAKSTLDAASGARTKPSASARNAPPPKSPEEIAQERFKSQFGHWQDVAAKKCIAAINGDPMRVVYMILLNHAGVLANLRHQSPYLYGSPADRKTQLKQADRENAKARQLVTAGTYKSIVKRIGGPKQSDLAAIAKQFRKLDEHELSRLVDDGIVAFANALDVEIDKPPQLDTFLKEELAKAKDAPAAADKKPAGKKDRGGDDDDLDDEE